MMPDNYEKNADITKTPEEKNDTNKLTDNNAADLIIDSNTEIEQQLTFLNDEKKDEISVQKSLEDKINYIKVKNWYNPNKPNASDSAVLYIIFLLAFMFLPFIFSFIIQKIMIDIFKIFDIYLFLNISILLSQGVIILLVVLYSKIFKINPYNGSGYHDRKDKNERTLIMMSIALIIGMMMILIPVASVFIEDIYFFGGRIDNYDLQGKEFYAILYVFIFSTFLPAICEELLFRGIILKGLLPFGKVFAIVASSLMFALGHGNFQQLLYQFFVGLAIGTVVVMSNNIKYGMIMHFANNLFASVYSIILNANDSINPKLMILAEIFFIVIGTVCLVVSVIYFIKYGLKKYKKQILNETEETDIKSCISKNGSFEDAEFIDYNKELDFSTKENKTYFYKIKKGFVPIRKKASKKLSASLVVVGLMLAVVLEFLNYWSIL